MTDKLSGVAIVGIAARFPGAVNYQAFWNNLCRGVNSITEIPRDRWDTSLHSLSDQQSSEASDPPAKWCGLVEGVELFDNKAFNVSAREASNMDPQQRLLLEETWHCIEDSGIPINELREARTAVFIGAMTNDYQQNLIQHNLPVDYYSTLGNYDCILANRISHYFGFKGSSLTIDTACASSLTALHLAKASILAGEHDYAIVGGVNLNLHPWKYLSFSKARMLSPDGQCKTFDRHANGYVPGDGVGVVLLQSLESAKKSRSTSYANIRGSASSHCGGGISITAPSVKAQRDCIETAYADAGINASNTSYVEMHGTGTSLGDPIEMEALSRVFNEGQKARHVCAVGSVKTNIGHLEAAAGIAGVIKVCLMMKHRTIPPSLNLTAINPLLNLQDSAFYLVDGPQQWNPPEQNIPLRAGVSSMGFGGTNAHILLEAPAPIRQELTEEVPADESFPFLISAKSEESLIETLKVWKNYLLNPGENEFRQVCINTVMSRAIFAYRFSGLFTSATDAVKTIEKYIENHKPVKTNNAGYLLDISALKEDWSCLNGALANAQKKVKSQLIKEAGIKYTRKEQSSVRVFLDNLSYLKALFAISDLPAFITCDPSALHDPAARPVVLLSLCISGVINLETAINLLLNNDITFAPRRPLIPLVGNNCESIFWPIGFSATKAVNYINQLANGPDASDYAHLYQSENNSERQYLGFRNAYEYYVSRAADLKETQHTFINIIAEWQQVLNQYAIKIDELISSPHPDEDALEPKQLLLLIIAYSSIKQLEEKWSLTDIRVVNNQAFNEIVSLLSSAVLTKENIISVILHPEVPENFIGFAESVNQNQRKIKSQCPQLRAGESNDSITATGLAAWYAERNIHFASEKQLSGVSTLNYSDPLNVYASVRNKAQGIDDLIYLWQSGVPVKWSAIYPIGSYQRLPLPNYVFTRSAFWFEKPSTPSNKVPVRDTTRFLLDPNSSIIKDHKIARDNIIPAALYLQMTLDHLASDGRTSVVLANVNFISPGKVDAVCTLELNAVSDTTIKIGLQQHDLAVIQWSTAEQLPGGDLAIKQIPQEWNTESNFSEVAYRNLNASGYHYGSSLKVIRDHRQSNGVDYVLLSCRNENSEFAFSEIFDGCLQSALAIFKMRRDSQANELLLPCFIKKIVVVAPLTASVVVAIPVDKIVRDGMDLVATFQVFSIDGKLLLTAEGVRYKLAPQKVIAETRNNIPNAVFFQDDIPSKKHHSPVYLYAHGWEAIPSVEPQGYVSKTSYIFKPDLISAALVDIKPYYFSVKEINYSTLSLDQKTTADGSVTLGDYCEDLWRESKDSVHWIDLYWVLPTVGDYFQTESSDYWTTLQLLLELCKFLTRKVWKAPLNLIVVSEKSVAIDSTEALTNFQWSGLSGLIMTLQKEKPSIGFFYVDLQRLNDMGKLAALVSARPAHNAPPENNELLPPFFALRADAIFAPALISPGHETLLPFSPESDDVYVISGGHTGIGLKVANHLMATYGVKVVALGRSIITEQELMSKVIPGLRYLYSYHRVDITDFVALSAVIQSIKSAHGSIKGVIHSSGLVRDRLFSAKEMADFSEVFDVKVKGLLNLDRATAAEPLRIFVAFSSVVATWGNPGQSDYALANATMDACLDYRARLNRSGKNISIRWSLWKEGGMGLDESIQDSFSSTSGVLTDQQGLDAFIQAVGSGFPLLSATAHPILSGLLKSTAQRQFPALNIPAETVIRVSASSASDDDRKELNLNILADGVYQDICEIFARLLGESVDAIDDNASFFEMGVESIVLKDIMRELEKRYENLPATLLFEYSTINELAAHLADKARRSEAPALPVAQYAETSVGSFNPGIALDAQANTLSPSGSLSNISSPANAGYEQHLHKGNSMPIAVIGMSGQFPQSPDLDIYWKNLVEGIDCIEEVPADRWNIRDFLHTAESAGPGMNAHNSTSAIWGGFIQDVDKFDALYFNIPPVEAEQMDPQQRLFLQCAAHALEHAGYGRVDGVNNKSVGVFVGTMWNEYSHLVTQQGLMNNEYKGPGSIYWAIANRVSYFFNLRGPSLAVDTACSSSLTSIALACQQIASGECEMAIAGGINLSFHPNKYIYLGQARFLANDGRCRSFGQDGTGYVPGEGVGAVILKSLQDAERDGDYIYGVIQGSSVNHGGKAAGFTVPNPDAQAQLVSRAISSAGITSREIDYVECHGTGTSLGDPIEVQGLARAFGENLSAKSCPIGSVKSNIGHLEAAAGIAAVVKVLLSYKNELLPKSLHSEIKNPNIDFVNSPFRVVEENEPWRVKPDRPRYASVSSFGAGGSNAHLLMASYDKPQFNGFNGLNQIEPQWQVFVISAEDHERLDAYIKLFTTFLEQPHARAIPLASIVHTMQVGRREMDTRCAIVVRDHHDLYEKLRRVIDNPVSMDSGVGQREWKRIPMDVQRSIDEIYNAFADKDVTATHKNLSLIANYWIKGAAIDWSKFQLATPRKAGLPTYPFAKERYWLTAEGEALYPHRITNSGAGVTTSGRLHPLIDENVSTFSEQAFRTRLEIEKFYLKDHVVRKRAIFPGAAYLELIFAASRLASGHPPACIRDIIWARPIQVDSATDMQLTFNQSLADSVSATTVTTVTINTFDDNGQRVQHAAARVDFQGVPAPVFKTPLDLTALLQTHYQHSEIYAFLTRSGFNYGETFQVMHDVWCGTGEALAKLVLPDICRADHNRYFAHPALMDGALRTSFAVDGLLARNDFVLSVPFAMKAIHFYDALPGVCYAYAKLIAADKGIRKYNITLLDEQGRCLIHLEEFSTRAFSNDQPVVADVVADNNLLIAQNNSVAAINNSVVANWRWTPVDASRALTSSTATNNILLIAANRQQLMEIIKRSGLSSYVGVVRNNTGFTSVPGDDPRLFELNTTNRADWDSLFQRLLQQSFIPDVIINTLPVSVENLDYENINDEQFPELMGRAINSSLTTLVVLFQAYHAEHRINQHKVRVHNLYPVSEHGQPHYDASAGLARALVSVNHNFKLINCGIDQRDLANLARAITTLIHDPLDDVEQRVLGEHREIRRKFYCDRPTGEPKNYLRQGGVYVITGGLGGLGLIFAKYLARHYSAHLVLNGRSPLDHDKQLIIDQLTALGGKAVYVPGDITNLADCTHLFDQATTHFNTVNGVFHAAGVLGNAPVASVDTREFFTPIAPKMHGILNIDLVTRSHPLDLMVLFSSVSVHLGDFGTGSYATGNKFLDSFAELREQLHKKGLRNGHTLSIDWPLWDDGGMAMPDSERAAYFNYSGMESLSSEEGIALFEQALAYEDNILLVAKGDLEKIARVMNIESDTLLVSNTPPQHSSLLPQSSGLSPVASNAIIDEGIKRKTEQFLKTLFSRHTGFPVEKINSKTDWGKYGIDSVKIMDMNASLQRDFGSLPGTLFFEYSTIDELSDYFLREHHAALKSMWSIKDSPVSSIAERKINSESAAASARVLTPLPPAVNTRENAPAIAPSTDKKSGDIAIIGLAGVYPQARDLTEFWENVCRGLDCITEVPEERWGTADLYRKQRAVDSDTIHKDTIQSKWGGFIADADKFDPYFFGITPAEAEEMSPQERLFLQSAWHAMEYAGYSNSHLQGLKVGVFAGVMWSEYRALDNSGTAPMVMHASVANRVSFALNLRGPSLAVDTMCSSSLTAIHLACESLRNGESEMAFAGGVNLSLHPDKYIQLSRSNFLSSDGRCRSFGDGGDGYVPGEGVGVILLKPLSAALADNDTICAVIKSSAINHGGRANAYTVPNPNAQREVINDALIKSRVPVDTITYLEAHGTGTPLGDPIEVAGLNGAFARHTPKKQFCALGSAKSLVGHLEAAAGVCAISKVVLQMQHRTLPPSLHSETINKNIDFSNTPFVLHTDASHWAPLVDEQGNPVPRRAGISSFGAGGSNAHLILEEAPVTVVPDQNDSPAAIQSELIVISAKSGDQLWQRLESLQLWLNTQLSGDQQRNNISRSQAFTSEEILNEKISRLSGIPIAELHDELALEECGIGRYSLMQLAEEIDPGSKALAIGYLKTLGDLYAAFAHLPPPAIDSDEYSGFTTLSLKNIAYTLQAGRDSMEYRLAFSVDSLTHFAEVVRENLSSSLLRKSIGAQTPVQIENSTWFGVVDDSRQLLVDFGAAEEDKQYLSSILENRNWTKVARFWVAGVDIDWAVLYAGQPKPSRVVLPGYPFLRERFWFSSANTGDSGAVRASGAGFIETLHPLIDKNISTLHVQAYQKTLHPDAWVISQHRIRNQKILPGAAQLEMARAAAEMASGFAVSEFFDLRWLAPVRIAESAIDLQLRLAMNGGLGFELVSPSLELHSKGSVILGDRSPPAIIDWQAIKQDCPRHYPRAEVYSCYADAGYLYGASFQVTRDIWSNEREAIAHLQAAPGKEQGFYWDPALLDGVLRSVLSIGDLKQNCANGTTLVPFSLARMSLFGALRNECIVHTRRAGESSSNEFDISVMAMDGQQLLELHKLVVLPVQQPVRGERIIAEPLWQHRPAVAAADALTTLAILGADTASLAENFSADTTLIQVNFAQSYRKLQRNQFCLRPDAWDDYDSLCANLESDTANFVVLQHGHYSDSLRIVTGLCRALLKIPAQHFRRIVFVYKALENEDPYLQMIAGLFRAVREINPALTGTMLGIDALDSSNLSEYITAELSATAKEVRYLDGVRSIRSWRELAENPESGIQQEKQLLRTGGNYIISGGLGGLGSIFAHHLVKQYQGNLLLIGRSPLDSDDGQKFKILEQLRAANTSVEYICADVGDQLAIDAAIAVFRRNVGNINGVFHAAGVLNPTSLLDISADDFNAAMAAKLAGSESLDHATRDDILDLFVLFSSVSSELGDFGSGSYAVANRFLDSFSANRQQKVSEGERHGHTVSINWPLWVDGGMTIPKEKEALYYDAAGMQSLGSEEGLELFYLALAARRPQVWVSSGNADKIRRVLDLRNAASCQHPAALLQQAEIAQAAIHKSVVHQSSNYQSSNYQSSNYQSLVHQNAANQNAIHQGADVQSPTANDELAIANTIRRYLTSLVAEQARMPENRIKPAVEFHAYGINSIMILAMNERLKKEIGNLSDTLFFEYNSIDALTDYFSAHHRDAFATLHSPTIENGIALEEKKISPATNTAPLASHRLQTQIATSLSQATTPDSSRDLAIIGVAGRYPHAEDMDGFWDVLKDGVDCITEVPAQRWDYRQFLDQGTLNEGTLNEGTLDQGTLDSSAGDRDIAKGKTNSKWGGFIEGIDLFDPQFFNITPKEATHINPQERLFLETAWHAMQDAGYTQKAIKGKSVGVFVGAMWSDYHFTDVHAEPPSTLHASIANRVSYVLDLKGPSLGLDSMCSSSLTAIHLASESILAGDCEMAFAGGVNLSLHPNKYTLLSRSNFLSTDGRCRSFGKGGEGYVPGEGVGAVLLKPLHKAIADGDFIYGVIKGSAINHVGKTNGYTVPNPVAQSNVIKAALGKGNIDPSSISYLEAHGTGTSLGDPIELNGLNRVFAPKSSGEKIVLGSVKSNMGHLEAAAGICALTKVLLQFKHGAIAPSLHAQEENPRLSFAASAFVLTKALQPWKASTAPDGKIMARRAGISSFGASGSNAHVIVEEFIGSAPLSPEGITQPYHLVPLSAKTGKSLLLFARLLAKHLQRHHALSLADIAYTLQVGRDTYESKALLKVHSLQHLVEALDCLAANQHTDAILYKAIAGETTHEHAEALSTLDEKEITAVRLWMDGSDAADWSVLHSSDARGSARRISLPGYVFDRKSFWLDHSGQYPLVKPIARREAQLHPLVHENVSTIAEQKFTTGLSASRDFVLSDHRVNGGPALPAAASLEMALVTARLAVPHREIILNDIIWLNLATPDADGKLDLAISLLPEPAYAVHPVKRDSLRFNLYTEPHKPVSIHNKAIDGQVDNSRVTLLASGLVIPVDPASPSGAAIPSQTRINIDDLQARLSHTRTGDFWYQHKETIGLECRSRFRGLQQIAWNSHEALAWLQCRTEPAAFLMHPALLDSAMQAAFVLIESCFPAAANKLALPASLVELRFIKPLPENCFAHVTWSSGRAPGSTLPDLLEFDVIVMAADGSVCVELKQFGVEISYSSANSHATANDFQAKEMQ